MEGFADKLQGLRRRSGKLPQIQVLQDAPDDRRLFNKGDDLHAAAAFRAFLFENLRFQGIDIPDLLQESNPHLSSAD